MHNDYFMVLADFESYIQQQQVGAQSYNDKKNWTKMSIINSARVGKFSSDRSIREYANDIWKVDPVQIKLQD